MSKTKNSALTIGQKKLHSLGILLPDLPITAAGSLPKHEELNELRYKVSKGFASVADLERREKVSTDGWLREQFKLGLDVLVDGEMMRGDLINYFSKRIGGFEKGGAIRIYGNRYYQKPQIKNKISWKEPLVHHLWPFIQRMVQKPVKAVLTGPYTLMDCSFNAHYSSREEALKDFVTVIRKEIEMLQNVGAKIIQIDELSLGSRVHEIPMVLKAIKDITQNIQAYFILRCGYDDFSLHWKDIMNAPVDNFYFEGANSQYRYLQFLRKIPTQKDITIGVVDSHQHHIETPQQILKNIRCALKLVPRHQLWLAPDSGLKTRTPKEASGKLSNLVKAVLKLR